MNDCAITGVAVQRRRERATGPPTGENSPRIESNYRIQAHPPRRAVAAIATSRAACQVHPRGCHFKFASSDSHDVTYVLTIFARAAQPAMIGLVSHSFPRQASQRIDPERISYGIFLVFSNPRSATSGLFDLFQQRNRLLFSKRVD